MTIVARPVSSKDSRLAQNLKKLSKFFEVKEVKKLKSIWISELQKEGLILDSELESGGKPIKKDWLFIFGVE